MEHLQLTYFCDAAETENFSKTAKKFLVPPSAISQSIHRLELELGKTLFDRTPNKIRLNENGKVFYTAVKESSRILEDAKKRISDSDEEISGTVKIQIFCNRQTVSRAIRQYKKLYPTVSFLLNHGFPSDDRFDLIISDEDFDFEKYKRLPLLSEKIAIALSKNHPLASKDILHVRDLCDEKFVTLHNHSSLFRLTNKICRKAGFEPKIAIQSDDPYYMRQYIEMGLGVGFAPTKSWEGQISCDIALRELSGIERTTYLYYNPFVYMSSAVKKFIEILISESKI